MVAALPEPDRPFYRVDAAGNPGNSGGPVCDKTGKVLGIHVGSDPGKRSSYSREIPHDAALDFIRKNVPGFVGPAAGPVAAKAVKDWPEVESAVSPATVLVLIMLRPQSGGFARVAKTPRRGGQGPEFGAYEDVWCMACGGKGYVRCAKPAKAAAR